MIRVTGNGFTTSRRLSSPNAAAENVNAVIAGNALRRWLLDAQPFDVVRIPTGVFNLGTETLYLPPDVTLLGEGPGRTILQTAKKAVPPDGCGIELANGSIVENLSVVSTIGIADQGAPIGVGRTYKVLPDGTKQGYNTDGLCATLRRLVVEGRDWGVYNWAGYGVRILIDDCAVSAGRKPIYAGASASGEACFYEIHNSRITADASLSEYPGDGGPIVSGLAAHGGRVFAVGCEVIVRGTPAMQLAVGLWIDPVTGHPGATVETRDTHVRVIANGAKTAIDVDQTIGHILHLGGSGSLPGGAWNETPKAAA